MTLVGGNCWSDTVNATNETCGDLPRDLVPAVVRPIVGRFLSQGSNQTIVTGFDVISGGANYTAAPTVVFTNYDCIIKPVALATVDLTNGVVAAVSIPLPCLTPGGNEDDRDRFREAREARGLTGDNFASYRTRMNYQSNAQCMWRINPPVPDGYKLQFAFSHFNTKSPSDVVMLLDGAAEGFDGHHMGGGPGPAPMGNMPPMGNAMPMNNMPMNNNAPMGNAGGNMGYGKATATVQPDADGHHQPADGHHHQPRTNQPMNNMGGMNTGRTNTGGTNMGGSLGGIDMGAMMNMASAMMSNMGNQNDMMSLRQDPMLRNLPKLLSTRAGPSQTRRRRNRARRCSSSFRFGAWPCRRLSPELVAAEGRPAASTITAGSG